MDKNAKIYVAGHRGLVGSALMRQLRAAGYTNFVTRTHDELDLTDALSVKDFFEAEKPEYVILAAAKVGGIHANNSYPADFIYENLSIQNNVLHQSYKAGVKRLLFLGSSCIYPKDAAQPIKEEYLLTDILEPTNRPYALAKLAGIEMCWSYNRQFKTQFMAVMPTNLYGPHDNYHPENSHVIPALIHKFHEAKVKQSSYVPIWGTGTPMREFLYSEDMAEACVFVMNLADADFKPLLGQERNDGLPPLLNIGSGTDISIAELAELVKEVVGFAGNIQYDHSKPDGTMRKLMDSARINHLGWSAKTSLKHGLDLAYADFLQQAKQSSN